MQLAASALLRKSRRVDRLAINAFMRMHILPPRPHKLLYLAMLQPAQNIALLSKRSVPHFGTLSSSTLAKPNQLQAHYKKQGDAARCRRPPACILLCPHTSDYSIHPHVYLCLLSYRLHGCSIHNPSQAPNGPACFRVDPACLCGWKRHLYAGLAPYRNGSSVLQSRCKMP